MILLIIYFLIFFLAYFIFLKLSNYFSIIDYPDGRKKHTEPTPLVGGLIIYCCLFFSTFLTSYTNSEKYIIYSSFILLLIGFIDDKINLNAYLRFFLQISFIGLIIFTNKDFQLKSLGFYNSLGEFNLYNFSFVFTILCLCLLINSINFIDGIDGYSSLNLILVLLINILYLKYFNYDFSLFLYLLFFIFLFFILNIKIFPLPKIFIGDAGTYMLSFVIGSMLIYYSNNISDLHSILIAWSISLPVFDFLYVFFYRLLNKRNPFKPDYKHFHHILLSYNLSKLKIFIILIILHLSLNLLGFLSYYLINALSSLILFIFISVIYIVTLFNVQKFYLTQNK